MTAALSEALLPSLGWNLDCDHMMTAELETYTLVVAEPTREDEPGSLLSRSEMR